MNILVNKLNQKNISELQQIYYKMKNKNIKKNKKEIINELLLPLKFTYKMGKYADNTYLKNITTFYQFKMKDKICTFLGEIHNLEFSCNGDDKSISVENYILDYVKKKPSTTVLLEITNVTQQHIFTYNLKNPTQQIDPGSFNLQNTFKTLVSNNYTKNIVEIDSRYKYLGIHNTQMLVHNPSEFNKLDKNKIVNYFINPFTKFLSDTKKRWQTNDYWINHRFPDESSINFMKPEVDNHNNLNIKEKPKNMLQQIYNNFINIINIINNMDNLINQGKKDEIRIKLVHSWKMVMDWECIYQIFMSTNDCIVLAGAAHIRNYINIFSSDKLVKISHQVDFNNCLSIYPTHKNYNKIPGSIINPQSQNKYICNCINLKDTFR